MRIINFCHRDLHITELTTAPGQTWCIFGENNSGIDRLIELFAGDLKDFSADKADLPDHPAILSFKSQQEIYEEELRNDDSDFLNRFDPGTLVCEFLPEYRTILPLLKALAMDKCLQLGYRQLSSGQSRKLLFLQKLCSGATTLIIQNPYDGLDQRSCRELDQALRQVAGADIELIVMVSSRSDIPDWCSHLAFISSGRLEMTGPREQLQGGLEALQIDRSPSPAPLFAAVRDKKTAAMDSELIFLKNGFAGYGDNTLFGGLDLTIHDGDHTLITGPNGCGKSTLLDIITGDNPKCYANDLRIFGRQRGSGESVWEIKKHMGIVSPALHREHRIAGTALHVVLSGLFDSIGLYTRVTGPEIKLARHWLSWLSLAENGDQPFRHLSFAKQRLILIARGLIKGPKLLILDEPTQGLDDGNRQRLLELLEEIARTKLSTILFVSHRQDEYRPFFKFHIKLDSYAP